VYRISFTTLFSFGIEGMLLRSEKDFIRLSRARIQVFVENVGKPQFSSN
jgi:hypothetical protein